jgi:hypothetical protein
MKLGKTIHYKNTICYFLLLALFNMNLLAEADSLRIISKDSLREIHVRTISQKSIDSLLQIKAFQYHSQEKPRLSFLNWLTQFLSKVLGRRISNIIIPAWLGYFVLISLSVFLIYKIFRSRFKPVFYSPLMNETENPEGIPDDIHSLVFDNLISRALSDSDFRTALRFHYLKLLRLLFDKGLVEYRKEKSNRDYQKELADSIIYKSFIRLTVIYEWAWYGKFNISSNDYSYLSPEFEKAYIVINV